MPGLPGATLVELPRKLHRTLATKRELHGRAADISESVVHTAVMGLLLMTGEVTRSPWPLGCVPRHRGATGSPVVGPLGEEVGDLRSLLDEAQCECRMPFLDSTLVLLDS